MDVFVSLVLLAIVSMMILLLIKLFKTPLKWIFKLVINGGLGFIGLFILNLIGGLIGIELGLNWVNAIVVGFLGVPGIILLLLLKYLI